MNPPAILRCPPKAYKMASSPQKRLLSVIIFGIFLLITFISAKI